MYIISDTGIAELLIYQGEYARQITGSTCMG